MQRRLLVTAISLGLLAATTTVLAETSPLEQQLKELPVVPGDCPPRR